MQRKPKVLFVYPNFHRYFVTFLPFFEPFVAIVLCSMIEDIAQVKIFDRRYETEKSFIKFLKEFAPDIIAFRIHTSGEIFTTKRLLEITKKIVPQATTIIGGQHPTLLPDDFNLPCVDLVCIGAGEETLREVVETKSKGLNFQEVKGLAIRKNGELFFTEERPIKSGTFTWPKLNRDLAKKYRKHFPWGITITSMGCPHRCNFCSLWVTARGTYRLRDTQGVVEDIASIPQSYIHIADDNTFHDPNHAMAIYEGLINKGVKKEFAAYARTDTIVNHRDIFKQWKAIGLKNLVVGFEAVNEEAMKDINKRNSLENNIKAIEILHELKINCFAHFIIFPRFTKKDFKEIANFIDRYKISQPYFVPLTPLAGTELFKEAKEKKELSVFHYGFYNLEYMVYKTALPKWRFYMEYILLWFKTISPLSYIKMRRRFSFLQYLYRVRIISVAFFPYLRNIIEQLMLENKVALSSKKEELFPSQIENYKFRFLETLASLKHE